MMQLGARHKASGLAACVLAPSALAVDICRLDPGQANVLERESMQHRDGYWWIEGLDWAPGSCYAFYCKNADKNGHQSWAFALDPMARWLIPQQSRQGGEIPYLSQTVLDLQEASRRQGLSPRSRLIYELHPKGFTQLQSLLPSELRGSIEALAHPSITSYLRELGVTTLCLMPIAFHDDEPRLRQLGLSNYWGYNVLAWNAPHSAYLASVRDTPAVHAWQVGRRALRDTIEVLHHEGFEVVLDVVYNHSAELDATGPDYHLRILDPLFYYHHHPSGALENWSGCGNCLRFADDRSIDWVIQSLRQWVIEFGVDGFRFDLATSLMRLQDGRVNPQSSASPWSRLRSDPLLSQSLFIAEPWDLGPDGYQLGQFGATVYEWNDRYRDTLRMFWIKQTSSIAGLADCVSGSSGIFQDLKSSAASSVNYLASHDGFTLADLLAYSDRHNIENGENNQDGHANEFSFNHGNEGKTENQAIVGLRNSKRAAMLCCLFASLGTVMLHAGDEWGRSQQGNNNAYCQDNPLSWLHWGDADLQQLSLCKRLARLRQQFSSFLTDLHWWLPRPSALGTFARWIRCDATEMSVNDWQQGTTRAFGLWLSSEHEPKELLLLFNGSSQAVDFRLPSEHRVWQCLIDSSDRQSWELDNCVDAGELKDELTMNAWSVRWLSHSASS